MGVILQALAGAGAEEKHCACFDFNGYRSSPNTWRQVGNVTEGTCFKAPRFLTVPAKTVPHV
eukprot:4569044-Amphidinium_carterae.1